MSRIPLAPLVLSGIILLGGFVRLWRATDTPPALSHDEVAIAYNAYSLLQTGRDEYGTKYPLLFRSFDDYKLPGMVYSTIIPIALLGLNETAVRLPSAFYGILSLLVVYSISQAITEKKSLRFGQLNIEHAAILTLFFALSPWHINFSRQLFESNGALFFLLLGINSLLRFPNRKQELPWAGVWFSISVYFYYSVRVIIPVILLGFIIANRHILIKHMASMFISVVIALGILAPFMPWLFSSEGFSRIAMVSLVNDPNYITRKERYTNIIAANPTNTNRLLFNRRRAIVETFIDNYLANVSPIHVFKTGTGNHGLQYPFEIPLILLGLIAMIGLKKYYSWVIIAWILASPLPGALSIGQPNALRTLPMAPALSILSGLGAIRLLSLFSNPRMIGITCITGLAILGTQVGIFLTRYFSPYNQEKAIHFADGQKQMARYALTQETLYDTIVVSGHYWRPYIFMLFWQGIDPNRYQIDGSPERFGKYIFGRALWDTKGLNLADPLIELKSIGTGKTLYILSPDEYATHSLSLNKKTTISGHVASDVFIVAE